MAAVRRFLAVLFSILALLAASAHARPCKTLIFSSYSLSIKPIYPDTNPNPNHKDFSGFLTFVTEISQERAVLRPFSEEDLRRENRALVRPGLPFPGVSPRHDVTSFHDRARDIISVVAAMVMGALCGAVTASIIYLVWSMFFSRQEGEFDNEDDELKKFGYVKIPAAESIPEPVKPAV